MRQFLVVFFVSILIFTSCGENYEQKGSETYIKEIQEWDQSRAERLKRDNGWLNLVGLYWLDEGENTFGSDKSNDIVFPSNAAPRMGSFILNDSVITVKIYEDVDVLIDSQLVKEAVLKSDVEENTTMMSYGSLRCRFCAARAVCSEVLRSVISAKVTTTPPIRSSSPR